ncbi:derepression protein [Salmonella enterica subsp. enterica]|uniref:Derepression protein n=1 Tax=Salmonella enterica subsp. enterica serovar Kisarawe TaxID=2517242 RepID=A0A5X8YVA7_SALET|nr:derepression protein [Salmonella enterica]EBY9399055.1 derepression protein [Salmonella enterica subsp. enterica serovar Kisarawe]EDS6472297.1 derepression protein [Salmonella enterica subsp. enterica]EDU6184696.1 derepression protein [Salmonella enterica subsp. houtenae serovar 44:z4,z23:-]ECB1989432.1 derepression protein [Salmonella enterica subsp. enterica serovar Kisarawe]
MANRKQRQRHTRADVQRIHTRTEINRRLYRASSITRIMYINMLHERSGAVTPSYIAAIFSYLADDLRELQQLVSKPKHSV